MAQLTLEEYTAKYSDTLHAAYELGNFAEKMDFDKFCLECWNDHLVVPA